MANRNTPKLRIGEALVRSGKLTAPELERSLAAAREAKMRLGEYLISRGVVTETDILDIIASQLSISRYEPERFPVDPSLKKLVPLESAKRYEIVPLCVKGGVLFVALLDAPDLNELFAIEDLTAHPTEPVICTREEFQSIFRSVYGEHTAFHAMMTEFEGDVGTRGPAVSENITSTDGDSAPVIRLVNLILNEGVRAGASDVHINPEKLEIAVRFRVSGLLRRASSIPSEMGPAIASRLKILANLDISVTRAPQDGRFTVMVDGREINVRLSTLPMTYGENIVMRLLDMGSKRIGGLPQLGMREEDAAALELHARKPYGMILSTGPTGSGKSTSLYSILQLIKSEELNIITLEDPVEYRMDGVRQVQLNTKAGMTFASGLRAILRQDPDIVMVGEIRDEETATIAVQAAMTGHLVLSTLHTNDALSAVYRLMDMGVEPYLVSSVLQCTFAQRLVRTVCPHCRTPYRPDPAALARLKLPLDGTYVKGAGCPHCRGTGFAGRIGIFEVLTIDDALRAAFTGEKDPLRAQEVARMKGFRNIEADAAAKVLAGLTTVEEVLRVTVA